LSPPRPRRGFTAPDGEERACRPSGPGADVARALRLAAGRQASLRDRLLGQAHAGLHGRRRPRSRPLRGKTRSCGTAHSRGQKAPHLEQPTARPSSGSPTPGGWASANASAGRAAFRPRRRPRREGLLGSSRSSPASPRHAGFDERRRKTRRASRGRRLLAHQPAYFDMADLPRLAYPVRPCPLHRSAAGVLSLPWMGVAKMSSTGATLVALRRVPVVWCLRGEGIIPYISLRPRGRPRLPEEGLPSLARYVARLTPIITPHDPPTTRRATG